MSLRDLSLKIALCGLCFVAAQAQAAEEKPAKSPGIIDLSEAQKDPDFKFQGEYTGYWSSGERAGEKLGLQVTPLGDGKFQAMEYRGGLPGRDWNRWDRRWWEGSRTGESVQLTTKGYSAVIANKHITITDAAGNKAGELGMVRRHSSTIGLTPPPGAIVLFSGKDTGHWEGAKVTPEGLLMEGAVTKKPFKDFRMHLEFMLPYGPERREQGRGNSGVYLQERYEVQILDSFGLVGAFNECGSLYRTVPPLQNMCLPPLTWQTYDIVFYSARFDSAGNKIHNAELTVRQNGELVQDHLQVPNKTGAGKPEGPEPRIIKLQDHHNPVRFRNIWIVELNGDQSPWNWDGSDCNCNIGPSASVTPPNYR
ncbi:MAG: DUF1080 domain-containing protein [Planctomycetales bacterium]